MDLKIAEQSTEEIHKRISKSRDITLHQLVAAFIKSLNVNLFTLKGVESILFPDSKKNIKPLSIKKRGGDGTKYKLEKGTVYQDPASNATWTAGGKEYASSGFRI